MGTVPLVGMEVPLMGEISSSTMREGSGHLRDGSPVLVRAPRIEDRDAIIEFLRRTSRRSMESRFFSPTVTEDIALAEVIRMSDPSIALSLLLFARTRQRWELVGHGEYVRDDVRSSSAEIAFLVTDAFQGKGVATVLLVHLARVARAQGIRTFRAMVLRWNSAMLEVFRGCGFPYAVEQRPEQVLVTVAIDQEPHPEFDLGLTSPSGRGLSPRPA